MGRFPLLFEEITMTSTANKLNLTSKSSLELENSLEAMLQMLDLTSDKTTITVIESSIERISQEIRNRASRTNHLSLAA